MHGATLKMTVINVMMMIDLVKVACTFVDITLQVLHGDNVVELV